MKWNFMVIQGWMGRPGVRNDVAIKSLRECGGPSCSSAAEVEFQKATLVFIFTARDQG